MSSLFCEECGSTFLRTTAKFCRQCETPRGIDPNGAQIRRPLEVPTERLTEMSSTRLTKELTVEPTEESMEEKDTEDFVVPPQEKLYKRIHDKNLQVIP